tara:strand:- start:149 stop:463 length:315 start_codon:yes stop_codon:yes gene_type:complete
MTTNSRPQADGAAWKNSFKKGANHPDWTGKIDLTRELLKEIVTEINSGDKSPTIEIKVAMWDRVSNEKGTEFKFIRVDLPMKKQEKAAEEPIDVSMEEGDDVPF